MPIGIIFPFQIFYNLTKIVNISLTFHAIIEFSPNQIEI